MEGRLSRLEEKSVKLEENCNKLEENCNKLEEAYVKKSELQRPIFTETNQSDTGSQEVRFVAVSERLIYCYKTSTCVCVVIHIHVLPYIFTQDSNDFWHMSSDASPSRKVRSIGEYFGLSRGLAGTPSDKILLEETSRQFGSQLLVSFILFYPLR